MKRLTYDHVIQFIDEGWDTKTNGKMICKIDQDSIACKYIIATQNFILSFYYSRWHYVGGSLVALNQNLDDFSKDPIVDLDV